MDTDLTMQDTAQPSNDPVVLAFAKEIEGAAADIDTLLAGIDQQFGELENELEVAEQDIEGAVVEANDEIDDAVEALLAETEGQ